MVMESDKLGCLRRHPEPQRAVPTHTAKDCLERLEPRKAALRRRCVRVCVHLALDLLKMDLVAG